MEFLSYPYTILLNLNIYHFKMKNDTQNFGYFNVLLNNFENTEIKTRPFYYTDLAILLKILYLKKYLTR